MDGLDSRTRSAEPDLTAYVRGARRSAIDDSSIVRRCRRHNVSDWIRRRQPASAQPRAGTTYP